MSQVYSAASAMVNGTNNYFAPTESEGIAKKGGRVFARATANTVLSPIALIETVVFAALTVITSPLALIKYTRPAFEWAKNHTLVAANATRNAAAGIIGRGEVAKKEAPAPAKTKWETVKEKANEFAATAMNFAKATYNKTEHDHIVGAAALASLALLGYYFNVHGKAYDAGSSVLGGISSGLYSAGSSVGSGLYSAGSWSIGKVGNIGSAAWSFVPSFGFGSNATVANSTVANSTVA